MTNIKILSNILLIVSAMVCVYIIIDVIYKKSMLKQNKINKIENKKYIILITIVIVIFVIYGLLRNFK